jgi:trans-aconitate methyltransferase
MSTQVWNAEEYARHGRFVADLAAPLLQLLQAQPGERILDLGCGDGVPTAAIAAAGADVLGVDSSAAMVDAARRRGVPAQLLSAEALPFLSELDAVYSNAALHCDRAAASSRRWAGTVILRLSALRCLRCCSLWV